MNLEAIAKRIDADSARAFVHAARNLVNAVMVEVARQKDVSGPTPRDYRSAGLSSEPAPGGWISRGELDRACQQMSEAMAAEKWVEGVMAAVRAIGMLK